MSTVKSAQQPPDESARSDARHSQFQSLFATGVCCVEGVSFDIRHPEILLDEWFCSQMNAWVFEFDFGEGPYLHFPWKCEMPHHKKKQIKRALDGDTVEVSRVEKQQLNNKFSHRSDDEFCNVYLQIRRPNGKITKLPKPYIFFRRGSFLPKRFRGNKSFENISIRIAETNGITNISDFCISKDLLAYAIEGKPWDEYSHIESDSDLMTWKESLLDHIQHLVNQMALMGAVLDGVEEPSIRERYQTIKGADYKARPYQKWDSFELNRIIDSAVEIGYSWAKFEDANIMQPFAEMGLASSTGGRAGGLARAKQRVEIAESTWKPHALGLATQIRKSNPHYSQDKVVEDVLFGWKLEVTIGSASLKKFISEMERQGRLPRRIR